jgi:hypothetical protein
MDVSFLGGVGFAAAVDADVVLEIEDAVLCVMEPLIVVALVSLDGYGRHLHRRDER